MHAQYVWRNVELPDVFTVFVSVQVPKVYWEYSTKRVLCMEYYSGGKVDDRQYMVTNGIDANEVNITTLSYYT